VSPWEALKIGSGTPPVMTRHGWMIVYHGVSEMLEPDSNEERITYSAGVMMMAKEHPQKLIYRSMKPVLVPQRPPGPVVRPSTWCSHRHRPAHRHRQAHRYDIYYGLNDFRIGVARLDVRPTSPHTAGRSAHGVHQLRVSATTATKVAPFADLASRLPSSSQ